MSQAVTRITRPRPRFLARTATTIVQLVVLMVPVGAQNQIWLDQFGTNKWDEVVTASPDGAGGVFFAGRTEGILKPPIGGAYDPWLAHYDNSGSQSWIVQFGSNQDDSVAATAEDTAGGVYLAGQTWGALAGSHAGQLDAWLARYDGSGNQVWARQIGTSKHDGANFATADGSGGVFVGGTTWGSLAGQTGFIDTWVARYDGAGNQVWIRQFGAVATISGVGAAALSASGGLFVAGYTDGNFGGPNAGGDDAWVMLLDSSGNPNWIKQLGTTVDDYAAVAAPDATGGVYVSGSTQGSLGGPSSGGDDFWLAHYDAAGNQIWIRQIGTSADDYAFGASPMAANGVYLCGRTHGSLGAPIKGNTDIWISAHDSSGTQLWIEQFGSIGTDWASAVSADGIGGLYVGGSTTATLVPPSSGGNDAWIARYDGSCKTITYCVSSSTSIVGCVPGIGATGFASIANPTGLTITSGSVPGANIGICFFGDNGRASIPFGTLGGRICVQTPFYRSKPKSCGGTAGSCDGLFTFTLQDLINQSPIIVAGAVINAEIWSRDPGNPDGYLLSDGLEFTVCP